MKMLTKITLTSTFMFLIVHTTYAACGITSGSIRILANDFPAIHAVILLLRNALAEVLPLPKTQRKSIETYRLLA